MTIYDLPAMFCRIRRILHHLQVLTTRLAARQVFTSKAVAPHSSAVSLPPELVLLILSYLPAETIVALALTCSRLHRFMPSPPRLSEEARLTLLNWLERDTPHLYLCFRCNELHTCRRARPDYRNLTHYDACCRNREDCRGIRAPHDLHYDIDFPLARVVMNRHLYGERHGPALKTLNLTATTGSLLSLDRNIKLRQPWTTRITGDELYLKAHVQLYHKKSRAHQLRQYYDNADDKTRKLVCHHVGVPGKLPFGLGQCPVRELDREPSSPDMFVPVTGTLQSCRYCFTDFRVNVHWLALGGRALKGWVVSVKRWHQLGSCRSPQGSKWNSYTRAFVQNIAAPRMDTCGAGVVYQSWRAVDDETTGPAEEEAGQLASARFAASS